MKLTVPTNFNFYREYPILDKDIGNGKISAKINKQVYTPLKIEGRSTNNFKKLFDATFELTTKHETLKQLKVFRFKPMRNQLDEEEQLILRLFKRQNMPNSDIEYFVQTGLFAGVVYHNGCEFNIECAYGNKVLHRMLNFLNNIYIDTKETQAEKHSKANVFQQILSYLFIHSLERSANLGLPKAYQQKQQHDYKMRGSIDMNAFLKRDIPFLGKISSRYREQQEIQPIIDVLYLTCEKLRKNLGLDSIKPVMNIYQQLKSQYSKNYVLPVTIQNAKKHTALSNPIFAQFRQTLEYAEIILNDWDLQTKKNSKLQTFGYLFDMSQLFEVYLEKLLAKNLPDWTVSSQEKIAVYPNRFYQRNMYPDIVLHHLTSDKVIVLDAKFKKMRLDKQYHDLDVRDFYQIHTYMQYYGAKLLFGGLIYPLSEIHNSEFSHSNSLFDHSQAEFDSPFFIVDGIEVKEFNDESFDIMSSERAFVERLKNLIQYKTKPSLL